MRRWHLLLARGLGLQGSFASLASLYFAQYAVLLRLFQLLLAHLLRLEVSFHLRQVCLTPRLKLGRLLLDARLPLVHVTLLLRLDVGVQRLIKDLERRAHAFHVCSHGSHRLVRAIERREFRLQHAPVGLTLCASVRKPLHAGILRLRGGTATMSPSAHAVCANAVHVRATRQTRPTRPTGGLTATFFDRAEAFCTTSAHVRSYLLQRRAVTAVTEDGRGRAATLAAGSKPVCSACSTAPPVHEVEARVRVLRLDGRCGPAGLPLAHHDRVLHLLDEVDGFGVEALEAREHGCAGAAARRGAARTTHAGGRCPCSPDSAPDGAPAPPDAPLNHVSVAPLRSFAWRRPGSARKVGEQWKGRQGG